MEELRRLRRQVGLSTQKEAAEAFRVSQRTWHCWEAGSVRVPFAVLELLRLKATPGTQLQRLMVNKRNTHGSLNEEFAIGTEHTGDLIAVYIQDDGLPPHIQRGDVVIVDRLREVYSGCIGLFDFDNRQQFGRLQYLDGSRKIVGARGELHPQSKIVGMAIEMRRPINVEVLP